MELLQRYFSLIDVFQRDAPFCATSPNDPSSPYWRYKAQEGSSSGRHLKRSQWHQNRERLGVKALAIQTSIEWYKQKQFAVMGKKLKRVRKRRIDGTVVALHIAPRVDLYSFTAGPSRQCRAVHDKNAGYAKVAGQAVCFQVQQPFATTPKGEPSIRISSLLILRFLLHRTTLHAEAFHNAGGCAS